MKLKLYLITLISMLLVLSACGSNNEESANENENENEKAAEVEEEVVLSVGFVGSIESIQGIVGEILKEEIETNSNGQMKIELYPSGQLGGERDMLESLRNGSIEMGLLSTYIFDAVTPAFNGLNLPFLFDDNEQVNTVLQGETINKALESLSDLNLKGLNAFHGGLRHFGTIKKPILTPDDFKGLKMRTAESEIIQESLELLGAIPTPIPYPDQYSAVQTGVVDGLDHILYTWYSDKFMEVVDHISLTNFMPLPNGTVINLDTFNSLTEEQQTILLDATKKAQEIVFEKVDEYDEIGLSKIKEDSSITVHEDIDLDPFRKKVEPIYEKFGSQDPLIQGVIDEVQALK